MVARLPSLVAGTALVVVVFLWTRREAGTLGAWVAGLLLALWTEGIAISQFARFYALQGLFVYLGAIAAYAVVYEQLRPRLRLATALGAGLAFLLAFAVQITTLIPLAGLGVWLALAVGLPWLRHEDRAPAWRWGAALGVLVGLLLLLVVLDSRLGVRLMHTMFETPLRGARLTGRFWYYHGLLSVGHPLLWSLVGGIALVAVAWRPRPSLFCLILFATAFVIHSIAAPKDIRYIYYTLPFLFALAGIAAQDGLPRVWAALEAVALRAIVALGMRPRPRLAALLAGLAVAFALLSQPDLIRTGARVVGIYLPPDEPRSDWAAVAPELAPWLARADVVLTRNELAALYFLGRYDAVISKSRLTELPNSEEFSIDPRTGRPVVSQAATIARIIDCYPTGLVVAEDTYWRSKSQIDDAVADLLVRRAEAIPLPQDGRVRAYFWQHPALASPDRCAGVPAFPGPAGGQG